MVPAWRQPLLAAATGLPLICWCPPHPLVSFFVTERDLWSCRPLTSQVLPAHCAAHLVRTRAIAQASSGGGGVEKEVPVPPDIPSVAQPSLCGTSVSLHGACVVRLQWGLHWSAWGPQQPARGQRRSEALSMSVSRLSRDVFPDFPISFTYPLLRLQCWSFSATFGCCTKRFTTCGFGGRNSN